jgi:LDH2 family malate/lactate/ureidoglycolate dehydrogenase
MGLQTLVDADGPDTIRMSVADARALGERALTRLGFDTNDARIVTDQLIDNALCGYRFASLARILAIAGDQKSKTTRRPIRIVRETPISALVDGGNNLGYVAAYRGAEIAVAKAKTSGISVVGVYDSYYSGRNAYYVELITRAGLIGIHTASASPHVLPPGGTRPALGTNPLSIGFPSKGEPIIYDIGTASMMWGEVLLHAHLGLPIPEGIGFDADGRPSTNAAEVAKGGVAPFGGHKGYGLSFAVQALGLLGGAALARGNVQDYAFVFIAIDPTIMLDQDAFETGMTQLVHCIKETPRAAGVSEIRVPSERAFRERARRLVEGIVIDRKVVESLQALCAQPVS